MADAGPGEVPGDLQSPGPREEAEGSPGDDRPQTLTTEAEAKCETELEAKADPEVKTVSELTAETGAGTGTETKTETKAETATETTTETRTEAESEAKVETVVEAKNKGKVDLLLKAAGDAPIMRQKLWKVDAAKNVTWVIQFIRRYIKLGPEESLFVYVSQAFSPAPDQTIGNLLDCFGSEGKLVLHYCKTQAWG